MEHLCEKKSELVLFGNLEEAQEGLTHIRKQWSLIKGNENQKFKEYTEEKINKYRKLLKRAIKNKNGKKAEYSSPMIQFKQGCMSISIEEYVVLNDLNLIYNELEGIHFKNKLDLELIIAYAKPSEVLIIFNQYSDQLNDDEYWQNLGYCYTLQDYNPAPYPILLNLFRSPRPHREKLMNEEDLLIYSALPEEVEIFRGMSKEEFDSKQFRISWTLNKEIAQFFAKRNETLKKGEHLVHRIVVPK